MVTGAATKLTVNHSGGDITIGADTTTTIDSEPVVGTKLKGSAVNPIDAAIAESVVNSSAIAQVGGGSTVMPAQLAGL